MANQLRDIKTDFISFVDKAAVRDPRDPSQPRRFLLFKSASGTPSNPQAVPWTRDTPIIHKSEDERTDDVATATDNTPPASFEDRESELAEMLIGLEEGRTQLLKQPPEKRTPGLLDRVEAAHKKIAREHGDLMKPGSAARAESVKKAATGGLADAQALAVRIQKADPSMSSSQAFVEAMNHPDIAKAYAEEHGGVVRIAKARQPGSPADVALKAGAIAKSEGLSASAAYARALRDLSPAEYAAGLAA
jgi:hypothetical protein